MDGLEQRAKSQCVGCEQICCRDDDGAVLVSACPDMAVYASERTKAIWHEMCLYAWLLQMCIPLRKYLIKHRGHISVLYSPLCLCLRPCQPGTSLQLLLLRLESQCKVTETCSVNHVSNCISGKVGALWHKITCKDVSSIIWTLIRKEQEFDSQTRFLGHDSTDHSAALFGNEWLEDSDPKANLLLYLFIFLCVSQMTSGLLSPRTGKGHEEEQIAESEPK